MSDLATGQTAAFILESLPEHADVLEIGCGSGAVALELMRRGHRVTGIDADPDIVASARKVGVNASVGIWPGFESDAAFDAVVFTRSLHHIQVLDAAIDRAAAVLDPGGSLIIEDFAFADIEPAVLWEFAQRLRQIESLNDEFLVRLRAAADPLAVWQHDHLHEIHSFRRMRNAVAQRFEIVRQSSAPYLFRYVPEFAAPAILAWETELNDRSIGRRIVAKLL
ncbi:MAG: class I SAM-dependent methyltransferase [Thermoanaerobaculia bacterium]|nr:class I SAM-dependent methyltransferase [Thermoanaerobaculia bacterium]